MYFLSHRTFKTHLQSSGCHSQGYANKYKLRVYEIVQQNLFSFYWRTDTVIHFNNNNQIQGMALLYSVHWQGGGGDLFSINFEVMTKWVTLFLASSVVTQSLTPSKTKGNCKIFLNLLDHSEVPNWPDWNICDSSKFLFLKAFFSFINCHSGIIRESPINHSWDHCFHYT